MKVLLVEDDATQRLALEILLEKLGHQAVPCEGATEALDHVTHDPEISAVVSDWNMPGGDGLELCRRIRRLDRDTYTYFILLTINRPTADNQLRAFDAGVDDFMSKPANADDLRLRLHVANRIIRFASQVRQLESFLPICSYCKRIRDDENYWRQIEEYVGSRTGTQFSHGICPTCAEKLLKTEMDAAPARRKPGQASAGCGCGHVH
jgi:phosphoserine phosphatase RsbU/P